jgi:protein arginine kinase activator
MLCERCKKNEASVFYRENINGIEKRYSLCSECAAKAQEKGEFDMTMPDFSADPFGSMFAPFKSIGSLFNSVFAPVTEPAYLAPGSKEAVKRCPLCGSVFNDFVNDGKVGCPECYDTFAPELDRTIKRIHGNVTHTGRAPKLFAAKLNKKKRLAALKEELKKTIEEQNFERSAQLRDEIRALEDEK